MELELQFGFKELFTHIISDMAKAVCVRKGETQQDKFSRSAAATHVILGFQPRDALETMVAGHIIMLHELMTVGVRESLQGEMDTMRRGTRTTILAMDRAFGVNLTRLQTLQNRPSQGIRDGLEARPVETPVDVQIPDEPTIVPEPAVVEPEQSPFDRAGIPLAFTPSKESIAACIANPEAMAAIEAGDAERFARAMGVEHPSAAYLEAAAGLPARLPSQFQPARRDRPRG